MRTASVFVVFAAAGILLGACASESTGSGGNPFGTGDDGGGGTGSSGGSSGSAGDGGNTGPCESGWTLVLGVSGGGQCPSGYSEVYMGVTDPTAQDGACTCPCNITQQPSCTTGNLSWSYGMFAPLCFGGSTPANSNGMCQPLNGSLQPAQLVQPLPATDGACTAQVAVCPVGGTVTLVTSKRSCHELELFTVWYEPNALVTAVGEIGDGRGLARIGERVFGR